jgi:O-acetyl-ADP-ribose deacetylase (regulator of RNase III)
VSLTVRVGDLGTSQAHAVVRGIRSDGAAITAVGRRIEVLAGPTVAQRLQGLGELPVGGAVITPAGDLAADFIIHAVLQSAEEPVTAHTVQRALVNALRRARDLGLETVALPPLGTGAGNLDAEESAHIVVEVLRDHLRGVETPHSFEVLVESVYEEELFLRELATGSSAEGVL